MVITMSKEDLNIKGEWKEDVDINKSQWKELLKDDSVVNSKDIGLLILLYNSEGHMATASQLADKLNLDHHSPINSQVGNLGKKISNELDIEAPKQKSGDGYNWFNVLFWGFKTDQGYYWQLRPELSEVLKELDEEGYIELSNDHLLLSYFEKTVNEYENARKNEPIKGHELGDLFRHDMPDLVSKYIDYFSDFKANNYEIKGSIGMGRWAKVPWLAILDEEITTTTQEGVYVVYLFSEDMERIYLTFNQGVTNTSKEELQTTRDNLRQELNMQKMKIDNEMDLASGGTGKKYEQSTIGDILYSADEIINQRISEQKLRDDLFYLMSVYKSYKKKYIYEEDIAED
jgi:hypothetical protein